MNKGEYRYGFSYRDVEHDVYEETFETKGEALAKIKELKAEDSDNEIIETWIYKNNEFKGRFQW